MSKPTRTPYPVHELMPAYMTKIGMQGARFMEGNDGTGAPGTPPAVQNNGNGENPNTPPAGNDFTPITNQEEFDQRIQARIARERGKYADYDELKGFKSQFEEASARVTELEATNTELLGKLTAVEEKEQHEALLKKVSEESGVPAQALRGSTEEELKAHAETLKGFVARPLVIPGQGNRPTTQAVSQEREAVRSLFGKKD